MNQEIHASIYARAADAASIIEGSTELTDFLDRLETLNLLIDNKIRLVAEATDSTRIASETNALRAMILQLPNIAARTNIRLLFRDIETVHEMLAHAFSGTNDPVVIAQCIHRLDALGDLYNACLQAPSAEASVRLLSHARQTRAAFQTLSAFLTYLVEHGGDVQPREGESAFSLDLSYTSDLDDFAQRLTAISRIYRELSELLIHEAAAPLKVAKIESGSLLTRLVGDTRVVELLVDVTRGAIRFYHRNLTEEGKIASIAPKVEAVEKALGLSRKLEEAGVDVGPLKEQLGKSAHAIAQELNKLLADQPSVSINGEVISVSANMTQRMLQNNRAHLLLHDANARIDPIWEEPPESAPGLPSPG